MAGLILTQIGSFKIPECEKCGSYMISKNFSQDKGSFECMECARNEKIKIDDCMQKDQVRLDWDIKNIERNDF